jgi:hypothetical protein
MLEALKNVVDGMTQQEAQSSAGFLVDVLAMPKKGSKALCSIEVDGPQALTRSLDPSDKDQVGQPSRVRGPSALKRRVLQKAGMKVVVVSEDDWRGLNEDGKKRDHLRKLLKKAGVDTTN